MAATSRTTPGSPRGRLRRSDCSGEGLTRVRRGRGFGYVDAQGKRLRDPEALLRIKDLAIPPAWEDVWICTDPLGHLQATGVDAAGRKQYLYHPRWREMRDRKKFDRMVDFAHALPALRRRVLRTLRTGEEINETRVLACAIRLLDVGLFRIGSEQYADDEGGMGLATVLKESVTVSDGELVFDYLGKSGVHRVQAVQDAAVIDVVSALRRRRGGGDQLLAYRDGRRWHDVRSEQINEHLKSLIGRGVLRQGLPDLERDGARRGLARRRRTGGQIRGGPQARDQRGGPRRGRGAGQHAGGGAPLLCRPPRDRPLPLGVDDRR